MSKLSDNMRGALLMMLSMTAFTVNDMLMKLTSDEVSFYQAIFLRGCMITAGLVLFGLFTRRLSFAVDRRDWALIALRSLAEVISTWWFLWALYQIPIANLSAIMQSIPLTVTLAAMLFFKEQVGWKRMSAIAVGLIGVILIIQPGTDGFTIYSLLGVASVLGVTVRDLAARRISRAVPSIMVAIAAAIAVTLWSGAFSLGEVWQPMTFAAMLKLTFAALFLMVGYIAAVSAMRVGEIGFVAPFRYASLLVALILGLVVFGDWPDALTLIGAGIVVATGLFTLYRERIVRRRAARAASRL